MVTGFVVVVVWVVVVVLVVVVFVKEQKTETEMTASVLKEFAYCVSVVKISKRSF